MILNIEKVRNSMEFLGNNYNENIHFLTTIVKLTIHTIL